MRLLTKTARILIFAAILFFGRRYVGFADEPPSPASRWMSISAANSCVISVGSIKLPYPIVLPEGFELIWRKALVVSSPSSSTHVMLFFKPSSEKAARTYASKYPVNVKIERGRYISGPVSDLSVSMGWTFRSWIYHFDDRHKMLGTIETDWEVRPYFATEDSAGLHLHQQLNIPAYGVVRRFVTCDVMYFLHPAR